MKNPRANSSDFSRRDFLKGAASAAAVAALPNIIAGCASSGAKRFGPNSRINVGVIGTGNQGTSDLKQMIKDERVQIVAICDVNRESAGYWMGAVAGRDPAKKFVESYYAEK